MRIFSNKTVLIFLRLKMIFIFSFFGNDVFAQKNIDFIEKVQTYQDSVKLIRTGEFPDLIDTSTFNIDVYFHFFDKLSLPTDLKLQYVFCDEKFAGCPILYVKKDSVIMENYLERVLGEYIKKHSLEKSKITKEFVDFKKYEYLCGFASIHNAPKYIIPEDDESGYLQFLFFNQFGEEFALKWHSNYGQKSVIFSNDEINRLYKYYLSTDLFSCDLEKFEKLINLNPSPIIKMGESSCFITWYEIATHHGIYKRTYEISRSAPHRIEKNEDVEILKIDIEFIY